MKRGKTWSAEEDKILSEIYPRLHGVKPKTKERIKKELLSKLPDRTIRGCSIRAWKIGLTNGYYWSPEEEAILAEYWPDGGVRTLHEKLPKRNWTGMRAHAKRMGLPERWQGYMTISQASKRLGYDRDTVLSALKEEGVTTYMRGGKKYSTAPKYKHRVVEWDEAQDAMLKWMSRETPLNAAEKAGVPYRTLLDWLKAHGIKSPSKGHILKIPAGEIEAIIAEHKPAWEKRRKAAQEAKRKREARAIPLGKNAEEAPKNHSRGSKRTSP